MITRENYEEYFLLYTDNELPAAERMEVERFVAGHPDLREEWETLLQCRMSPEADLVFHGRSALLKPGTESSRYTDDLLLYLDNELDQPDKIRIETIIAQQPSVLRELAELRQAIVHPDPAIVYPDKEDLLRNGKSRRVIALPWLRVGIAASVAGAVALLLLLSAPPRKQLAVNIIKQQPQVVTPTPVTPPPQATVADIHNRNIPPAVTPVTTHPLHYSTGHEQVKKEDRQDLAVNESKKMTPPATAATIDTRPGKTIDHPDPVGVAAISAVAAAGDLAVNVHPAVETGIPKGQSSFATQALQEEANDERNSNFISDEPAAPGKARLRGIFRKVTRAFGKTADRDNDGNRQVLVGAFQVSLN